MLGVLSSLSLLTQRKFRRHSQAPSSSILTTLPWKVKETEGRKNFACGENVVRKSETGRRWKFVMGTSILLREKQCFARVRKSRGCTQSKNESVNFIEESYYLSLFSHFLDDEYNYFQIHNQRVRFYCQVLIGILIICS